MGARNVRGRPSSGWLALAVTLGLALAGALATGLLGPEEEPREPANESHQFTRAADDGRFRLGPEQVPSVFGLTAEQAVDRLEALGLQAAIDTIATCRDLPGRALWTRPGTGRLASAGTEVVVTTAAPGTRCLLGDLGPDREAAWRFLDFADGRGVPPSFAEDLFRNDAGAIDAVLVSEGRPPVVTSGPPDVVGNSATFARDRLEAAGYSVDEATGPGCGQVGTVSSQAPSWGDEHVDPGATVTLAIADRTVPCQSAPLRPPTPRTRAADALIAFARGEGPAPATGDRVEVYVGDELRATLTPDTVADPASWVPVLDRLTRAVAQSEGAGATDDSCLVRGDLPSDLSEDAAWRLSVPEPRDCRDDWSVLVWVDDAGAITAVDLLTGRT